MAGKKDLEQEVKILDARVKQIENILYTRKHAPEMRNKAKAMIVRRTIKRK